MLHLTVILLACSTLLVLWNSLTAPTAFGQWDSLHSLLRWRGHVANGTLYYPWNDGVDYDRLCHILLRELKSPNNSLTILNWGIHGGIGHKFTTLILSLTNALMLKRNYLLNMHSMYWDNIDSCLKELRYDGSKLFHCCSSHLGLSHFQLCKYSHPCHDRRFGYKALPNLNLMMEDYRIYPTEREKVEIVTRLRQIGFLRGNEGYDDYFRYVIRILYNPSRQLVNQIIAERNSIGPAQYQIGAQIRCGGYLADTNEQTAMITPEKLKLVPDLIKKMVDNSTIPRDKVFVYLSTDSTYAARVISEAIAPIPVRMTHLYSRGHSTDRLMKDDAMKRAFVELVLAAESQSLLLTSESTYGKSVNWMSRSSSNVLIDAPYVPTNATVGQRSSFF